MATTKQSYKLVLRRLGDDTVEIPVSDHGRDGAPSYSQRDCEQMARRFMGLRPWTKRRDNIWTNGDVVLGIYPYYPDRENKHG